MRILALIFYTASLVMRTNSGPTSSCSPTSYQHNEDLHRFPYNASNGIISIVAWKLLLYENYIKCSLVSQLPVKSITHAQSMSSRIWFNHSVWPSVCGWKTLLKSRRVPNAFWSLRQKANVKCGSWSDTIDIGTPCNLTISFTYSWV